MEKPLVSIIIPTYNRAHLIGETLDSVLAQTYENWECIVVDDGSTDNTDEVMARYCAKDSRFRYYHRPDEHKPGGNGARNFGFLMSKGEYVNWFDSDDLFHPEKINLQVAQLETNSCDFSVCKTLSFKDSISTAWFPRYNDIVSKDPLNDYITKRISWLTNPPLWRRCYLEKLSQLFDEDLRAAQEWDFHVRVLLNTQKYCTIEKPLVYLRNHSERISTNEKEQEKRSKFYFSVRKNVLVNYKSKISKESENHLYRYIYNLYKKSFYNDYENLKIQILKFILSQKKLSIYIKFNASLAYISYLLFNKGNVFLKKIK